jgi:hypothetical protein
MILPFLCHPHPPADLEPFKEIVEMTTVFTMQRYRLGSVKHTDPEEQDKSTTWLFDVVTDPDSYEKLTAEIVPSCRASVRARLAPTAMSAR